MDTKTKDFLRKVDYLIEKGVVKNAQAIIDELEWNKSVMSSVRNDKLPVPQYIYNKFKEIYAAEFTEPNGEQSDAYKDKYIALLEQTVVELKQRNEALAQHVNSSFQEVKTQAVVNRSFLKTILQVLARVISNQEKKTVEKIHSEIGTLLGEVQTGAS